MTTTPPSNILDRFVRTITTSSGLDATLATTCYASLLLHAQLGRLDTYTRRSIHSASLKNFYDLLEDTRVCTRLTGIFTLYSALAELKRAQHGDIIIKMLQYASLISCTAFQVLENIALLKQHKVLRGRRSIDLWVLSNRFWVVSLICDLVRLARERCLGLGKQHVHVSSITQGKGQDKGANVASSGVLSANPRRNWLQELCSTISCLPLAINWSFPEGQSPISETLLASSGLGGGMITFGTSWEETR